ncbi:MAG: ABC transporter ATP-binding protein [Dethiobacter sp.]|jgi:peptide/nickel transport system ATP-binding protein|nr:MAG: ABC transporter ATP-binding protein [Dethiobacter sp.]
MIHVLEVRDLKTQFRTDSGVVQAVDGISYYIDEGEIVGLVGESGCGKSVSQLSLLQLIPMPPGKIVGGEVIFEGFNPLEFKADSEQMRAIRGGKIGIIFQEPMTSLNPVLTIGQQIIEVLVLHLRMDRVTARRRAIELLKLVGIPDAGQRIDNYPHQLSGGMRQRVMIAMALSCNPRLLVADEATTALDVTTQAQLLELLQDTVKRFNTSLLIVTHNLGIVARYAHRIYVMYAGRVVESGTSRDIFGNARHPYTVGLLKAVPRLDEPRGHKLVPIEGLPPNLINRSPTCVFLPRCSHRVEQCQREPWPELRLVDGQHYVSCHVDITKQSCPSNYALGIAATLASGVTAVRCEERASVNVRPSLDETLLEVKNLKMYFPVTRGLLRHKVADVKAVDDVSFKIKKGETLGLVGESGCGKTTVARCILRMYRPTEGQVIFEGRNIAQLPKSGIRPIRHKMQLIFQDPYSSLDPRQNAGSIVGEPLKIHHLVKSNTEYQRRLAELFRMVGLDPGMKDRVPHEFSGGQRQRIGIARALACNPSFIVCDEPISALDVSIQAQIINLLEELQHKLGLTYLFIAHDLSVVRHISDRVAVMYLGRIVEITDWKSLYESPLHPYTQALLSAVPIPDPFVEEKRERIILKGEVPSLINLPLGCNFHPRCSLAIKECKQVVPLLRDVGEGHEIACIRV